MQLGYPEFYFGNRSHLEIRKGRSRLAVPDFLNSKFSPAAAAHARTCKAPQLMFSERMKHPLAVILGLTLMLTPAGAREFLVFFGTYTGAKSQGIYVSRFDNKTGKLSAPELAAETKSPSFLAAHPNERWLYAVGEATSIGE